jgi:ribosomal protein L6P/L9E
MSSLNQYSVRQPKEISVSLVVEEEKLFVERKGYCFSYPLLSSGIFYAPKERKLWIKKCEKTSKAFTGLYKILLGQVFLGVLFSYRRQLNIIGIGYQASVEKTHTDNVCVLKLGYSHLVYVQIPSSLEVKCPKPRIIVIKGINLQRVSNFAQAIRRCRVPSTYKEKGIYLLGEPLRLKQGKKT